MNFWPFSLVCIAIALQFKEIINACNPQIKESLTHVKNNHFLKINKVSRD